MTDEQLTKGVELHNALHKVIAEINNAPTIGNKGFYGARIQVYDCQTGEVSITKEIEPDEYIIENTKRLKDKYDALFKEYENL